MTLVRRETARGHSYKLDGKPVKGVTTLLNAGIAKPFLVDWAAKEVATYVAENFEAVAASHERDGQTQFIDWLKAAHRSKRDEAAARGTEVHAIAERLVHGDDVDVPQHLLGYVEGYARFLDAFAVAPVLVERPCGNRKWWYAGTFDLMAGLNIGGRWMLDVKTSRRVYGETGLQLAAYAESEFYIDEDGAEQTMPEVDGLGVIHVTPTGTDLYLVEDRAAAWKAFQHAAWLAKQSDAIKSLINEPTIPNGVRA